MMEIFIGRQPIFDLYEQVGAYELLYRSKNVNAFTSVDADAATVDVLVNAFLNFGIGEVTNGKPCFVNFTENLLVGALADFLNPNQVVIEILEDVPITPQIVQRVKELKAAGFRIALDDFILDDQVEIYNELFAILDYIKVDFLLSPLSKCMEIERIVKRRFPHVKLLAEKVETREQFEAAKESGYELFQGYFFEKPQIITTTDLPANTVQCFQIMSLLNEDEPDVGAITEVIERDISLSYKLLHFINSSNQRGKSTIQSIKQAILMMGLIELKKWLYLLAMQENFNKQDRELHLEIMRASLFRAKICERLAKHTNNVKFSTCFLTGMFSLMDTLLQRPMYSIIEQLPFSLEVSDTITGGQTKLTPYLECSIALEKMHWERAEELLQQLEITNISLQSLYNDALKWAEDSTSVFS